MKWLILSIYLLFTGFILTGFYLYESPVPELVQYDLGYIIGLILLTILMMLVIPWMYIKQSTKHFIFSLTPLLFLAIIGYFLCHYRYYSTQEHLFDPFLQMPPTQHGEPPAKKENDFVIVCLGGSTTENKFGPPDKTYPAILEKNLQELHPELNIKVYNGGMGYYTTKHSLINYTTRYTKYDPDLVVVMHAVNDIIRCFSPESFAVGEYRKDYGHYYGPSILGATPQTFESHVFSWMRARWYTSLSSSNVSTAESDLPMSSYISLPEYKYYYSTLLDYLQKDSVKTIVLEQSDLYQENMGQGEMDALGFGKYYCYDDGKYPSVKSLSAAMDMYNNSMKAITETMGIPFVETQSVLPKTLDYYLDDVHYTVKGTTALAKKVTEGIEANGLVE